MAPAGTVEIPREVADATSLDLSDIRPTVPTPDIGKRVRLGSSTRCGGCDCPLPAGSIAHKTSRRAETYHERCHADQHGRVNWYRCEACAAKRNARLATGGA